MPTVAEMQDFILTQLDINTMQLAKYCRMYPNMMMDWRHNNRPAYESALKRLNAIYAITYKWALSGTVSPGQLIFTDILDGMSLEDVLTADNIDAQKAEQIQQAFAQAQQNN